MAIRGNATKAIVCAIDGATGGKKTGDAAQITINIMDLDTGTVSTLTDTSAAEISATNAPGYYVADVTAGEYNADRMISVGKSSTSGVTCIGFPLGSVSDIIAVNNTAATLQTDLAKAGDAMTLTSGERTSIATAVWAATTRTLSTFGTLVTDIAAAVWAYATRILTAATNITSNAGTIDQTKIANLDATISSRASSTEISNVNNSIIYGLGPESTVELTYQGVSAIAGIIGNPSGFPGGSVCEDIAAVKSETAAIKLKTDTITAAPSASDNATAVWAAGTRTLTSSEAPTVEQITTGVWSATTRELTSDVYPSAEDIWTYPNRTTTTSGTIGNFTIDAVVDGDGNPIAGATVTVTTDLQGTDFVDQKTTDEFGVCSFTLDPGIYYLWIRLSGKISLDAQQVEVTA